MTALARGTFNVGTSQNLQPASLPTCMHLVKCKGVTPFALSHWTDKNYSGYTHQHKLALQPGRRMQQQRERHRRGFAGARRRLQHQRIAGVQRRQHLAEHLLDRQALRGFGWRASARRVRPSGSVLRLSFELNRLARCGNF